MSENGVTLPLNNRLSAWVKLTQSGLSRLQRNIVDGAIRYCRNPAQRSPS
jgi:hypothetical protein